MRPAEAFTLLFPGTPGRLNLFLNTSILFNSDVATDSDNAWSDGPTVDAHVFQGWVYDYYFKRFGRNGMDDRNSEVDSIVHPLARSEANRQTPEVVGQYINNAFYCCEGVLVFGDGDGTHVHFSRRRLRCRRARMDAWRDRLQLAADLSDESGALNEAFSDIMGAAMEFFYQPVGTGRDQADWLIAEDVYLASPGYLRSAQQPQRQWGIPITTASDRFIGTTIDDGGVHFNLTIATHAFYLAVAGGTAIAYLADHRTGRRHGEYRADGTDFLPRIHAADGPQLAVLRCTARHDCRPQPTCTAPAATSARRSSSPGPPWG